MIMALNWDEYMPNPKQQARKRAGEANSKPVVDPLLFDSAEPLTEPVD